MEASNHRIFNSVLFSIKFFSMEMEPEKKWLSKKSTAFCHSNLYGVVRQLYWGTQELKHCQYWSPALTKNCVQERLNTQEAEMQARDTSRTSLNAADLCSHHNPSPRSTSPSPLSPNSTFLKSQLKSHSFEPFPDRINWLSPKVVSQSLCQSLGSTWTAHDCVIRLSAWKAWNPIRL